MVTVAPVFAVGTLPAPLSPPTTLTAPVRATALSPPGDSEQRLERRRKQCRVSQRRYRDKKGSVEYNLRLDVNSLRESVERLRQTRQLLESRLWSDRLSLIGPVRKAVEQYYVMFSQGLHDASAGEYGSKCYDVQVGFLRAFLDPDVMFGESKGVENVLEQWRRYSVVHETMWVKTVSAEIFGTRESPIAVVDGLLGVRMSRGTIEALFPHIVGNEVLVQALIGQEIVYDTRTTYTFNDRNQVLRQDLTVDFLSGLTKVLNSTTTTSRVLTHALITASSKIGDVDEEPWMTEPVISPTGSDDEATEPHNAPEPEPEDGSSVASPFEVLDDDTDDVDDVLEVFVATKQAPSPKAPRSRFDLEFIMS